MRSQAEMRCSQRLTVAETSADEGADYRVLTPYGAYNFLVLHMWFNIYYTIYYTIYY